METEKKTETQTDMQKQDWDKTGIGTKESSSLAPKGVVVMGHRIEEVKNKAKEVVGEKVVLICKHPDREDHIELSKVRYLKGDKVTSSGLWFSLDEDQLIPKKSALAYTLNQYECLVVADLDGKTISTDLDGVYLVVKAY